jgi:hypothetical protein
LAKAKGAKRRVLVSFVASCHPENKTAELPKCSSKETKMLRSNRLINAAFLAAAVLMSSRLFAARPEVDAAELTVDVYDQAAYTEYVQTTMEKLDKLYLNFCGTCGVDAVKARIAKDEFLVTVRELMQYMNARYDKLDPKMGAALSPTETLVSVHALTMLVDILAATELEQLAAHPYIE